MSSNQFIKEPSCLQRSQKATHMESHSTGRTTLVKLQFAEGIWRSGRNHRGEIQGAFPMSHLLIRGATLALQLQFSESFLGAIVCAGFSGVDPLALHKNTESKMRSLGLIKIKSMARILPDSKHPNSTPYSGGDKRFEPPLVKDRSVDSEVMKPHAKACFQLHWPPGRTKLSTRHQGVKLKKRWAPRVV